jgi:hypothetical protein
MPRRAHQVDPLVQRQVEAMTGYGIPEADISRVLKIDPKTLRKYYSDELNLGHTKANAQVAGFLFNSARNGNVTAQIFWLKTRARWKEQPTEVRHSGSIARVDIREIPDEDLEHLEASLKHITERDYEVLDALTSGPLDEIPTGRDGAPLAIFRPKAPARARDR